MPEPDVIPELCLTDDMTRGELVMILENVVWYGDGLSTALRFDKGVMDFVVTAIKQR
ncbi:MAG: hypothetical protein WAK55_18165 [Xanthobacteraceae bacterium]